MGPKLYFDRTLREFKRRVLAKFVSCFQAQLWILSFNANHYQTKFLLIAFQKKNAAYKPAEMSKNSFKGPIL